MLFIVSTLYLVNCKHESNQNLPGTLAGYGGFPISDVVGHFSFFECFRAPSINFLVGSLAFLSPKNRETFLY